jgi:hypothetical protein
VSQKGRLRRLDAGVRWLETEGTYIRIESMVKSLEMLLDIADRADADPAFAARWKETFPSVVLPPPRRKAPPSRPKSEPAPPPERAPERAPVVARRTLPPQDEPPRSEVSPPAIEPRPAPVAVVMEKPPPRPSDSPAPMPGMPVSPPSPDMEIRPVRWRERGPHDYYEEEGDTYGRCITEYDVLRDEYDDDA